MSFSLLPLISLFSLSTFQALVFQFSVLHAFAFAFHSIMPKQLCLILKMMMTVIIIITIIIIKTVAFLLCNLEFAK